jgi:hypothetical protein
MISVLVSSPGHPSTAWGLGRARDREPGELLPGDQVRMASLSLGVTFHPE